MIDRENKELRRLVFENDESDYDFNNGYSDRPLEWFKTKILPDLLQRKNNDGYFLDIGCASGYFTKELTPFFKKVIGVDFSNRRIEHAKLLENDKLNFYVVDLTSDELVNLNLKFDTLFSNAVIPHIPLENKVKVFENLYKVSNDNAELFLYDGRSDEDVLDQFVGMYNENWLIKNISHCWEFKSIHTIENNTCVYYLIKKI